MHEWVVSSEEAGSKLLAFLSIRLGKHFSARSLKRAIENNCCLINGRTERFASTLLGLADHVTLFLDDPLPAPISLKIDSSRIIFEDSDILIYNKPAGVSCDDAGLLKILKNYHIDLQLVHRLDRDTTGAMILVKNKESFENFLDQFKQFQVEKCYRLIVDGITGKEGVIDNFLGKKKQYSGQTIWGAVKTGGMRAVTIWRRIKSGQEATLLHCFPKTGRTHQIRVHMSGIGHPILGDFQYGKTFKCKYRPVRYLLHAEKISFLHPKTREAMTFEAKLSEDFLEAQNRLFGII